MNWLRINHKYLFALTFLLFLIVVGKAQKLEDTLRHQLVNLLEENQNYDQAVSILKEKKDLTRSEIRTLYHLQQLQENTRRLLDSSKMALALNYKQNDVSDKAENLFLELRNSNFPEVRSRANVELDSLIKGKKKAVYNKYPITVIWTPLRAALPWIIVAALIFLLLVWIYWRPNGRMLAVKCFDEYEKKAFQESISLMLRKIQSSAQRGQRNASIVSPGTRLLPHLEFEVSQDLNDLLSESLSFKWMPLAFLTRLIIRPRYILTVIIEKQDSDVRINSILRNNSLVLLQWERTIHKNMLQSVRMDMAYETLMEIQSNLRNP